MSPMICSFACDYESFPRVSGDEPNSNQQLTERLEFSPRERG